MSHRFLSRLRKFTYGVILFVVISIASLWVTSRALEPEPFGAARAPDPLDHQEAIIQVYGADVWGFRGNFAIHTWIATKPRGAADYQIYQVIGWRLRRGRSVVSVSAGNPARPWYGSPAILLHEIRGAQADALIGQVHASVSELLRREGAHVDAFYYCPHHPREGKPPYRNECDCRKPRPGMLLRAAREHDIDLARSSMIGDSLADLGAASGAGVTPIHVLTGYGRGLAEHHGDRFTVRPAYTAEDLLDAVRWILGRDDPHQQSGGS